MMPDDSSTSTHAVTDGRPVDDGVFVFPASFAQQRLWLHDQIEPGRAAYNVPFTRRMRGVLDVQALERALSLIVERHEPLRTVFDAPEGQALQVVLPPESIRLDVIDVTHLAPAARETEALRLARVEANRPFNLRIGPVFRATLVRLAPDDHVLLVTAHHIAVDGWSLGILTRELTTAYNAFVAGDTPTLAELPIQYADFAVWQRDALTGSALESQVAYWREHLRGPLPRLELPLDRPRDPESTRPAGRVGVHVPADVTAALLELCRAERVTPFVLLLAAYFALLHRYTGDDDIVVASPTSGRGRRETEGLIGFFVNTLALRTDVSGDPTFRELLHRVRDVALGAMANQDLPFERVVEIAAPRRESGRMPVAQAMFAMQDMVAAGEARMRGLVVQPFQATLESAKFDVQMLLRTSPDGFRGNFDFDRDLFDDETAERFVRQYETLLGAISRGPGQRVSALDLLDEPERARISAWSEARAEYPRNATVPELFDEWVARTPRAVALRQDGNAMTYAELQAASERIATHLRGAGVVAESLVGIALDRSFAAVAAMLAVLRVGAAYVPLDPDYPVERLSFMLADTGASVVLTQDRFAAQLTGALQAGAVAVRPRILDVEECLRSAAPVGAIRTTIEPVADNPAYVMYTSGSTGQPKGVVVPHRAIVRLVRNTNFATLGSQEVMLGAAPISFDASTLEIWGALLNGGRLVLVPSGHVSPHELGAIVRRHGVTIAWLTAALFNQVVDGGLEGFEGVRQILAGGEVLSVPHVVRAQELCPACRFINGYGPTENTTFTTCYSIPSGFTGERSVPIGRPIANTTVHVLDSERKPVPVGVLGELYAGGDGLALGYLNRPELTAERFVGDPFSDEPDARMYRTGDIVRWRADGTIEYVSRRDEQVKLRGYRVELGEIEAVLARHADVASCAVVMHRGATGASLAAYYVPAAPAGSQHQVPRVPSAAFRAHLRRTLPEFMVPNAFVALESLPLSPAGKVDRRALAAMPLATDASTDNYVPPRTTLEHELVRIWESLLPKRPIGIEDDFFEIGGHSLLGAQMLAEVERTRGQRLPLSLLFEEATINRIAAALEVGTTSVRPEIVTLQADGSATPFAFAHGDVRGGGWYCRRLAPMLGATTPLIVLPTLAGVSDSSPMSIEEIARAQIALLRDVRPRGPYRLGGFCAGGLVAYEMALQLTAAGEKVERVILVDAAPRGAAFRPVAPLLPLLVGPGTAEARLERRAALLRRLHYYRGRLRHVGGLRAADQARWLSGVVRRAIPGLRGSRQSTAWPLPPEEFRARRGTRMLAAQSRAAAAYVPGRYAGRIDVIWATGAAAPVAASARGWDRIAGTVHVHSVASPHVALITYDLPLLAERIRACLEDG